MAPNAIFKAFRPIDTNSPVYSYDVQNVTVNLEDRTLVSDFSSTVSETFHTNTTLKVLFKNVEFEISQFSAPNHTN